MKTHTVCLLILIVPLASAWTDESKTPDEAVVEYGERGLPLSIPGRIPSSRQTIHRRV